MKVLVTCPPMLRSVEEFRSVFESKGLELICPQVVQTLSEAELIGLVPQVDAWIIGDDPATEKVFQAGKSGKLKAAVKWGVGVDNVDFKAARTLNIPISNTPAMFGEEVSDIALAYLLALARQTHQIDRKVRQGLWFKPPGMSLSGKKAALIGFGNIGKSTARKLKAFQLDVNVFDPLVFPDSEDESAYTFDSLDKVVQNADFLIITCALTSENRHLINDRIFQLLNKGAIVINVSRGPLVNESDLNKALESGQVGGAGLDVFENEPLAADHPFLQFDNVIFGSHNGSNTKEAVRRASKKAIELLFGYLNIQ
ncbi:MAG TPA: phosphoglycerate dehydrogenase [Flavitalea sp.]|nr:phosphoglycerate dehydrogenase [Flavitalea sp.]